jgi:hypothetical protein
MSSAMIEMTTSSSMMVKPLEVSFMAKPFHRRAWGCEGARPAPCRPPAASLCRTEHAFRPLASTRAMRPVSELRLQNTPGAGPLAIFGGRIHPSKNAGSRGGAAPKIPAMGELAFPAGRRVSRAVHGRVRSTRPGLAGSGRRPRKSAAQTAVWASAGSMGHRSVRHFRGDSSGAASLETATPRNRTSATKAAAPARPSRRSVAIRRGLERSAPGRALRAHLRQEASTRRRRRRTTPAATARTRRPRLRHRPAGAGRVR